MTPSGAYADELSRRARSSGLLVGVVALVVVPAWAVFDHLLEPEHAAAFTRLRLVCEVPMAACLWLLWKHPAGRRHPELLSFVVLAVVQAEIGWMVVRASSAREFYLLGFSLAVYASGCVLGGPLRWTASLVGATWTSFGAALLTAPEALPRQDLTASLFYLSTASLIGLLAHGQRDRLTRAELVARARLEQEQDRTQELLVRLERLSNEDPLTGLANRRRWDAALAQACDDARTGRTTVALVLIDVDRFKEINDQWGHECGDCTLQAVAGLVSRLVGDRGLVARLGGDELGVLLPATTLDDAARLADVARREARALEVPGAGAPAVSLSLGVTAGERDTAVPQVVMRSADEQLYRAKLSRDAVCTGLPRPLVPGPREPAAETSSVVPAPAGGERRAARGWRPA